MSNRDELVARLQTETRYVGLTRATAAAADQIERDGREIERLREALSDLAAAYAACNGEDHPAYRRARAALNEGDQP